MIFRILLLVILAPVLQFAAFAHAQHEGGGVLPQLGCYVTAVKSCLQIVRDPCAGDCGNGPIASGTASVTVCGRYYNFDENGSFETTVPLIDPTVTGGTGEKQLNPADCGVYYDCTCQPSTISAAGPLTCKRSWDNLEILRQAQTEPDGAECVLFQDPIVHTP